MNIRETRNAADPEWLSLRAEFIPELSLSENQDSLRLFARHSADFIALIADDDDGQAMGFVELSIRNDYVNGCRYRPTLFLEGIYVRPHFRRRGVARKLCAAAGAWGRDHGCREFASDVFIDDADSLTAHVSLGFVETERVVYFRKLLAGD